MPFMRTRIHFWLGLAAICLGSGVAYPAPAAPLDRSLSIQSQTQQDAVQSQGRIDKFADETEELAARSKSTLAELNNLRTYNDQIEKLVAAQQEESTSLARQLKDIEVTEEQIEPLVRRMLAALDETVNGDIPFLTEERQARLQQLHAMMNDAALSIAEKFQRVINVYGIELGYGRSVAAYRGQLAEKGSRREVDFLRIGRVALLYRTLDGKDTGYWDKQRHQWVATGAEYSHAMEEGLRIARKETAPDLIDVPVPAAASAHD